MKYKMEYFCYECKEEINISNTYYSVRTSEDVYFFCSQECLSEVINNE